jgi:hypothetical protein
VLKVFRVLQAQQVHKVQQAQPELHQPLQAQLGRQVALDLLVLQAQQDQQALPVVVVEALH